MNPRGGRHRTILDRDVAVTEHLRVLVTRVTGMTRAIRDNATPDLRADPMVGRIATEVARIGADVRALGRQVESTELAQAEPEAFAEESEPALTAPLEVVRPNSRHWVLIGALLEDIRRVREELLGEDD
jgi:hypothetical protein